MSFMVIYYVNVIGECILGAGAALGNGLVLMLIVRDRRLQTVTNYFVASLAAADLLVGIVGIPCVLVAFHGLPHNFYGCLVVNAVIVIFTQISIFGLLTIAIERFVAIKDPLHYTKNWTGKTATVIISISWVAAILVGLVPVFGWNLGPSPDGAVCSFVEVIDMKYMVYFNFFVCVLSPLAVIFGVYMYIYKVVRHQMQKIASLRVTTQTDDGQVHRKKLDIRKEIKAAKWFAVVILLFAVCWLPLHIMNTVTLLAGKGNFPALIAAILLSHLNSAINPLLYALGNTKFQQAWRKVMGCVSFMEDSEHSHSTVNNYNSTAVPNPAVI